MKHDIHIKLNSYIFHVHGCETICTFSLCVGFLECGCFEQNSSFSLFFINNIFKIVLYFYIILNINIVW